MKRDDAGRAVPGGAGSWPSQWSQPAVLGNVVTTIFFAAFGVIGVVAGVSIFLPGFDDDRAYLLVLAAPLLFGVATIVILTRLRVRHRPTTALRCERTDGGEPALVIPYSAGLAATYMVVCATTLVLFVVVAVASVIALVAAGMDTALLAQAAIAVGFTVYLGWTLMEVAHRRLRTGAVIVTPSGVWHRSWAFDSYLSWTHTASVSAGDMDGQLITLAAFTNADPQFVRRSRLWKQPEHKLAPHTAIRGMYLAIDPALALHTLHFYHANPAARAELGSETAVHRARGSAVSTGE